MEAVHVQDVTKRFGATMALRGVTATFTAGKLTIITGPNGSGKTTLLGILSTTIRPTGGRVWASPEGLSLREHVGLVSHEALAYADLSGRRNVELTAEWYGLPVREAWEQAKARFELGAFAERPLRTNSRGQRQRIALARALVHGPRLVLLDEPTTGLDARGVARLLEVVQDELDGGAIVVVVAHDDETFAGLGGRKLAMDRGRMETSE
jgi:heme exporter protein A